jgi:L-ascorbate metabolism protein UlaG (beta-lactamase superfamily)
MDARGAALACNEFLDLEVIVPMHYKTFPVLADKADEFKKLVKRGRVAALNPGETLTL